MEQPQDTTPTPEGTGLSQWDAQKRLGELLVGPADAPTPEDDTTDELHIEAPSDEAEPEAPAEDPEEDEGDVEAEAADTEDEQDEAMHTVMVDGEEEQVTYSELLAGYSRHGHYKRLTREIADERRELGAEQAELRKERQQYAAVLPQLQQMLESVIPARPDPHQYSDPMEYHRADREWEQLRANIDALSAERARTAEQLQKDQMAQWQAVAEQEHDKLLTRVPAWTDEKVRTKEQEEVRAYLLTQGYSEQDTSLLVDHRAWVVAQKAMAYDALNVPAKRKRKKSKTVKPGSTQGVARTTKTQDVVDRAKKSGKESDAAAAFAALLTQ